MPILKKSCQKVQTQLFPCQKSTQEQRFEGLHQEKKLPSNQLMENLKQFAVQRSSSNFSTEKLCIIEDDKKYCKKDFSQLPGHQYYYQSKGLYFRNKFKCIQTEKFALKILMWQASCSCGLKSAPFIT